MRPDPGNSARDQQLGSPLDGPGQPRTPANETAAETADQLDDRPTAATIVPDPASPAAPLDHPSTFQTCTHLIETTTTEVATAAAPRYSPTHGIQTRFGSLVAFRQVSDQGVEIGRLVV